jgi:hypothetical protein
MTKLIFALATTTFAVLASASLAATPIARKPPPRADRTAQGTCWWEPPVYYRHYAYFLYYPYDDVHRRPGCHNAYYAPRWSGYRLNVGTN